MKDFFLQHGVKSVPMTDGNMGCPHEESEDFPHGEECRFCPFRKGKQRPKWFDLAVTKKRMPSIYMLEADCLTIYFNQNDAGERPKTIATDKETELSLIVLKRQRP